MILDTTNWCLFRYGSKTLLWQMNDVRISLSIVSGESDLSDEDIINKRFWFQIVTLRCLEIWDRTLSDLWFLQQLFIPEMMKYLYLKYEDVRQKTSQLGRKSSENIENHTTFTGTEDLRSSIPQFSSFSFPIISCSILLTVKYIPSATTSGQTS